MRSRIGTSSIAAVALAAATLTGIALGAVSTASPAAAATVYTAADVQAHKTAASCWSIVDGNVYDLTSWINVHKGGSAVILAMCGADGSVAFHGMHGTASKPATALAGFKIGSIGTATPAPSTSPTPSPTTPTPIATVPAGPCGAGDDDDDEDSDDDHASGCTDSGTVMAHPGRLTASELLSLAPAALAALSADKLEKYKGSSQLRSLSTAQIAALNAKQIKALGLNKVKFNERQKKALEKARKHH